MKNKIKIGSRGSKLALLYAQKVKEKINFSRRPETLSIEEFAMLV